MEIRFNRTQGLDEAKAFLSQALASGKFPHALLVHGPAGMGQNALVLDLAEILLCEDASVKPCGRCAGCQGKRNENLHFVFPVVEKSESGDARKMTSQQVDELVADIASFRSDPYGFTVPEKAQTRIAQMMELQGKIAFSIASGHTKIAILHRVETMDAPVANAFLKTLEEPPPETHFLLVSEDRSALLPTILSRCTQLPLFPMAPPELRAVLTAKAADWDLPAVPERLLPFAEGSPGALLDLHRNGGDTLVADAGDFFAAALAGFKSGNGWLAFADYAETAKPFEDMQGAAPLLLFLLRAIRLFHSLRALEPAPASGAPGAWTRSALVRQGLDPGLAETLAPLEAFPDLRALSQWIEELLTAVRDYAKPKNAALGLYLEYLQKQTAVAAT